MRLPSCAGDPAPTATPSISRTRPLKHHWSLGDSLITADVPGLDLAPEMMCGPAWEQSRRVFILEFTWAEVGSRKGPSCLPHLIFKEVNDVCLKATDPFASPSRAAGSSDTSRTTSGGRCRCIKGIRVPEVQGEHSADAPATAQNRPITFSQAVRSQTPYATYSQLGSRRWRDNPVR